MVAAFTLLPAQMSEVQCRGNTHQHQVKLDVRIAEARGRGITLHTPEFLFQVTPQREGHVASPLMEVAWQRKVNLA